MPNSFTVPDFMIPIKQPMLWYDPNSDRLNIWGGLPFDNTLWPGSYTTTLGKDGGLSWDTVSTPATSEQELNGLWGSAFTTTPNALYSVGGYITMNATNIPVTGMLQHDFKTNTWSNKTTSGADSRFNIFAQLHYIPNFGSSGVLALFGGERPPNQTYAGSPGVLADMSYVDIYDIESSTWYAQKTTGDIPGPSTRFSSAGTSAARNDSYEMYVNILPSHCSLILGLTD